MKYWSDRRHFGVLWKVVCSEIITANDLPGTINNVHLNFNFFTGVLSGPVIFLYLVLQYFCLFVRKLQKEYLKFDWLGGV